MLGGTALLASLLALDGANGRQYALLDESKPGQDAPQVAVLAGDELAGALAPGGVGLHLLEYLPDRRGDVGCRPPPSR